MGRKNLFSLIEIAVAMAIAAFGIAAIMALLPIAIKSTSDSVGDTLAADVANTVIAQLDRASWEHFEWIQNLPGGDLSPRDNPKPRPKDFSIDDLEGYLGKVLSSDIGAGSSYEFDPKAGPFSADGECVFLYGSKGKTPDFVAEILCWQEQPANYNLTTIKAKTGRVQKPTPVSMNKITYPSESGKTGSPFVRVYVEISWPITKPYESGERQSRLFVREYLDPAYFRGDDDE